jgi:uncharacterized cupin superfamily protein
LTSQIIINKSNIGIFGGFNAGFTAHDNINRTDNTFKTLCVPSTSYGSTNLIKIDNSSITESPLTAFGLNIT